MLRLILEQQAQADAGSALLPESFPVRYVAVQRIGAHGLLQDKESLITSSIASMSMYDNHLKQRMDEPGKVVNSARRPLNRGNEYFLVPVRA